MSLSHCITHQVTRKCGYREYSERKMGNVPPIIIFIPIHQPPTFVTTQMNSCVLMPFFVCFALSSSFELRSTYSRNPVSWQRVNNRGLATHSGWKDSECTRGKTSEHIPSVVRCMGDHTCCCRVHRHTSLSSC